MNIKEYIIKAKSELDAFQKLWEEGMADRPGDFPSELEEGEWGDQELASRFGNINM